MASGGLRRLGTTGDEGVDDMQHADSHQDIAAAWAGITDPKERRKLQNRINQRESRRKRRAAERAAAVSVVQSREAQDGDNTVGSHRVSETESEVHAWSSSGNPFAIRLRHRDQTHGSTTTMVKSQAIPKHIDLDMMPPGASSVPDAQRIWHYGLTVLLPTMGACTQSGEPLQAAIFRAASLDSPIFYATLACSSSQRLSLTRSPGDTKVFLIAQNKTAQAVRKALRRNILTDDVVFGMMSLALQQNSYSTSLPQDRRYRGAFTSPMRNVGDVAWLGSVQFASEHADMWAAIIKGCLNSGKPFTGLMECLQLADLYRACLSVSPPGLELTTAFALPCNDPEHFELGAFGSDTIQIGHQLRTVLSEIRLCCHMINEIDLHSMRDYNHFIRHRNHAQYNLLQLTPHTDKLARLAALVFSYGVLFPISDPRPVRQLTKDLCFALLDPGLSGAETSLFLLWSALIGGVAAWAGEFQEVFAAMVARHAESVGVRLWSEIVPLMEQFLWLESACDFGAQGIWTQAVALMDVGSRNP